jgi:hypothetical protein
MIILPVQEDVLRSQFLFAPPKGILIFHAALVAKLWKFSKNGLNQKYFPSSKLLSDFKTIKQMLKFIQKYSTHTITL